MDKLPELTDDERRRYEWQMWSPDFGELGQRRLKGASVLVSRVGGVGGTAALTLAAAGVGKLVLAHAGNVRLDDLNRQLLMTTDWLGQPRVESAKRRLHDLNPHVEVEIVPENVSESNAAALVSRCDAVVGAAPLFAERLLLNREAVRQNKPLVDCAMYDMEGRVTTVLPGRSACLACLYPTPPALWKREFPVFGAVSSAAASMASMEVVKLLAGVDPSPVGRMLTFDLRTLQFLTLTPPRLSDCPVCGAL